MDAYTLHLLGMAVEACAERDQTWIKLVPPSPRFEDGWVITLYRPPRNFPVGHSSAPTLADALAALLRDLGVEVPERPTAERRAEVIRFMDRAYETAGSTGVTNYLLADRERVLALLEEGS